MAPRVTFLLSPKLMPSGRKLGRTVLIDLAFAYGEHYFSATQPFLERMGDRLVGWVDHHPHPKWSEVAQDPRFVLVEKRQAPACPELITPQLVQRFGPVDDILAHADFDGCIAAAKYVRGGEPPYPEADEDARCIDAPGWGFTCSPAGERLARAIDQARVGKGSNAYLTFLRRLCDALVEGYEPPSLASHIDNLAEQRRRRLIELDKKLEHVEEIHPQVALLRLDPNTPMSDRKALLQRLEQRAPVAIVDDGTKVTVATFDTLRFDLRGTCGLEGTKGLVWGKARPQEVVAALLPLLDE